MYKQITMVFLLAVMVAVNMYDWFNGWTTETVTGEILNKHKSYSSCVFGGGTYYYFLLDNGSDTYKQNVTMLDYMKYRIGDHYTLDIMHEPCEPSKRTKVATFILSIFLLITIILLIVEMI